MGTVLLISRGVLLLHEGSSKEARFNELLKMRGRCMHVHAHVSVNRSVSAESVPRRVELDQASPRFTLLVAFEWGS